MAHRIDDRWLWLGTGALLLIAFRSISYAIHDTVRLTEVEPLTTKEQDEDQQRQPEDSLTLEVLHSLATSPNPNISKAAIDLIAARCAKSKTLLSSLQADAVSSDPELRRKAQTALEFLGAWTSRNGIGNGALPSASGGGGVRAVGQIDVPVAAAPSSSGGGTSISGLYEFDDDPGHFVRNNGLRTEAQRAETEAATIAWRVARRADGSEVGELTEPELRQRRREAMVLQHDGVEVFSRDDTDDIPPRTAP